MSPLVCSLHFNPQSSFHAWSAVCILTSVIMSPLVCSLHFNPQSLFHPWSGVCILTSVFMSPLVCSLHFNPQSSCHPWSAVCILTSVIISQFSFHNFHFIIFIFIFVNYNLQGPTENRLGEWVPWINIFIIIIIIIIIITLWALNHLSLVFLWIHVLMPYHWAIETWMQVPLFFKLHIQW